MPVTEAFDQLAQEWAEETFGEILCQSCIHYHGGNRCVAYPGGIPLEIVSGEHGHRESFKGDHGLQYEPRGPNDVWQEGPGRGWWGPPVGTHGTGKEGDDSGYAGGGESRAGDAETIAKGDDTELYRWGNLTDVHSSFLGKRTRSLDTTDRPEWYFAPPSMLKSDSWTERTYGRYLLDRATLAKAGWSKDPRLKTEGAWRWKPGNLGKGWQDVDDKFVGNSFLSSIKGYEVVSLPRGVSAGQLGDWFKYRTGRKIPITVTNVSNITDPFRESAGPGRGGSEED